MNRITGMALVVLGLVVLDQSASAAATPGAFAFGASVFGAERLQGR